MKLLNTLALAAALTPAALAFSAGSAQAQVLTAQEILNDYNLVVFGSLTQHSEVDGKAFVGGNLTGGGNYDIHNVQASTIPALTVGGTISGNINLNGAGGLIAGSGLTSAASFNYNGNGNIYVRGDASNLSLNIQNGQSVYVTGNLKNSNVSVNNAGNNLYLGGTATGSNVNVNGAAGYYQKSTVPATVVPDVQALTSSYQSTLTAYSSNLSTLTANSSYTISGDKATFTATPNASGLAVFDITDAATFFKNTKEIAFSLGSATEVVINVSGAGSGTLNINENFLAGIDKTLGSKAIWNFTDASDINITSLFGGDVLAVYANLTTSADVEGTVVANALTQGSEIHYDGTNSNLPQVPLPAALPLFATALAGMIGFGKARRKRQA